MNWIANTSGLGVGSPSQTVYGDVAYAPYGETYAQSGTADFSWTGINADVEPANPETLYDFPAREYGIQGRWPSPDPLGLGAVNLGDPQSWNRYAYVGNNPLAMTDPTGMGPEDALCAIHPVLCIVAIFGNILEIFKVFGHHHHPTPHAAPAPPGGYGAGIDPYGTWDEKLPSGVQVFPGPLGSTGAGCTYGSGNCGGMIYGFGVGNGSPQWKNQVDYLDWLQNALTLAGSTLMGQMGHCYGGDAICIPGHAPVASGNLGHSGLDDAVNMGVAAPFDATLMEGGALFGTRYAGNTPLLNANDYFRVGWTYMRSEGGYAWRATGKLLGGVHLWANPMRWF